MGNQYHYDKHGNYTGKSSDTPPQSGGGCAEALGAIGGLALICWFISAFGKDVLEFGVVIGVLCLVVTIFGLAMFDKGKR